ncbi:MULTISPECIES: hypothetical protein [unclassified Providencia]|uniref:hypothetical protein n=1 Tax=unclassified Providencia TaxID=2633465 RepID=UPI00234BF66D|nr:MULTISPECIES: hypothetical protein [unclassified Providencia]
MSEDFDFDGTPSITVNLELSSFEDIRLKCQEKRVCVFLGAGFSKAWDNDYPLSNQLFSISDEEAEENKDEYNFFSLFDSLNLKWAENSAKDQDKAKVFKSFKYMIDVYKRYPSLLPSHLDKHTVSLLENEIKSYIKNKFKRIVKPNELKLNGTGRLNKNKTGIVSFSMK